MILDLNTFTVLDLDLCDCFISWKQGNPCPIFTFVVLIFKADNSEMNPFVFLESDVKR